MANEEVLGPRKTMFVLVVVVGCFAVLWPRILSPLIVGHTREQLKPNQFDREAGCCEVMFETDIAVLELINEVCSSAVHADGKLSPYAAAECRKAVNETCGVDIAAFLKRSDNVGKTSKLLIKTMQSSNSSCLKEHFGVPTWSVNPHLVHSWAQDTVKQERSPIRAGPHPALRERGRAIPPGAPTPPSRVPVPLPPHVRVRSSPLSVYFELDAKPPPIPGMRPPLGSPGGPVPAPKSSMGFVMPIYTICIIVFFVYTLSKILFKRTGPSLYDPVAPDPQFRRRVFRDDSRASPDKLVVTAISGLVAEVQQQMEASYGQNQQRQDVQDNHTRPYTNGTILHNSGPVHIVASEYREISKERSPEPLKEEEEPDPNAKERTPEPEETAPKQEEEEPASKSKECTREQEELATKQEEPTPEPNEPMQVTEELDTKPIEVSLGENEAEEVILEDKKSAEIEEELKHISDTEEPSEDIIELPKEESIDANHVEIDDLLKLTGDIGLEKNEDGHKRLTEEFLREESNVAECEPKSEEKLSTQELLEEAIQDSQDDKDEEWDTLEPENASVKVLGMELTAHSADGGAWAKSQPVPQLPAQPGPAPPPPRPHEAEEVKSIFLETEIPQKSRVLVADFAEDRTERPAPTKHSPMVVSGKMTLSLIQDAPRETPERDPESTVDDFTTASAVTQNAAEKEDDLSDEEIEEEIEIEEIEEELEDEEEEEEEPKDKKHMGTKK